MYKLNSRNQIFQVEKKKISGGQDVLELDILDDLDVMHRMF